jgi:GTP-binding protein EngB required for normal cell division
VGCGFWPSGPVLRGQPADLVRKSVIHMVSLGFLLARAASSIPNPTPAQREILERLNRLRARLDEGMLRVAVLGQFKRGKSTLLNALLGAPVLPTGVTPVTAIPTFIKAGPKAAARITFKDDREPRLTSVEGEIPHVLDRYISEVKNPHNRFNVESVEIEIRSDFLDQGIVLVDTPGVGSTYLHNTQAAEKALTECDVAIFVVSSDPPITEVEVNYLRKVQELIPKIFFALNKVDLLDIQERRMAERFLADVLKELASTAQPFRIFSISARQGLQAKQYRDSRALAESGVQHLEQVLARELAQEKREIIFATGRLRSISLVGELLFQTKLEHKALLTPEEDLKQKVGTFESSVARFESERRALSDFILVDRARLLKELDAETDRLWKEAQNGLHQILSRIAGPRFDEAEARNQIMAELSRYFEQAFREFVELFRTKLSERLAVHQGRAGALINLVRQTAADLMEIAVVLPQSNKAFEVKREPYWVAPETVASLLDLSASVITRFLPSGMRESRARRQLAADADKAVLRNIANLDWTMRQNIEEGFRRFESCLSEQLSSALHATRQAMHIAIDRRAARIEEIDEYVKESTRSIASLSDIFTELQAIEEPSRAEIVEITGHQ